MAQIPIAMVNEKQQLRTAEQASPHLVRIKSSFAET